jgi:hypothetical protein
MNKVLTVAKENEMISAQLDRIDESIGKLVMRISKTLIEDQDCQLGKDEIAAITCNPKEDIESTIIRKRLTAIDNSIANIERALAKDKAEVGSNCSWVKVCTFVACTKWGPPDVSGGAAVCIESECRAWEYRFVCK